MEASSICDSISATPHCFLRPSHELHIASRLAAKSFLDPLTFSASKQRRNTSKKAQGNSGVSKKNSRQGQPLYIDGFSVDQIWEQAVRIISHTSDELNDNTLASSEPLDKPDSRPSHHPHESSISEEDSSLSGNESYESDSDAEQISEDADAADDLSSNEGSSDIENGSFQGIEDGSSVSEYGQSDTYVEDKFNLNDGFFSIDDFNKQSEYLENLDAKGAPEEFSDEEEIDWHIAPTAASMQDSDRPNKKEAKGRHDDESSSESEDDGPTFGNADLMNDDSDGDMEGANDDAGDWIDTTEIKYDDFFAPPARKASRKKSRPLPKTQPSQSVTNNDDEDDGDVERAMADVRRDIFDDVSENSDVEMDEQTGGAQPERSTHEKQRAKIADEIRRLEMANVAEKAWMLAGEAKASQRPVNSLIENDLDFERIGKPVPVVTNETSEAIEQLIKQRILAKEFDEVVRRLPDLLQRNSASRGRVEVDQNKSQHSLAELYEKEHLKMNDPGYVDEKDEKLKRHHAEIDQLWRNTSSQLDVLSNWHYKPKIAQPSINVISDVATVAMEEARPSGAGSLGEQGTLAPQEIYAPNEKNGFGGEVVLRSGLSMAKDEMSREDKSKRRRKQKEQLKNAKSLPTSKKKADEGQQIVTDLKKGGVNIVGDKGQLQNLDGEQPLRTAETQAGRLKL
ncbi:uncharacterized protein TRUGW13939_03525 [Talaromyces rugulosus]|uniref:U3 small nucleolar ribonucleoprotein protein MPP10 n=1 Tax=Talaromyces rugulosus TaxID=121627 RepID=A0A7H8QR27_TALRU|nr:uncharacterized protein TRUGW13939_03525 [Talaromyces rugulosus]QKX56420.1 hypothetical protein TRUGW13939_03525 [Talaromyces rugulosus]